MAEWKLLTNEKPELWTKALCWRSDWSEPEWRMWKENGRIVEGIARGLDSQGMVPIYFGDPDESDDYDYAVPENFPTHWMAPSVPGAADEIDRLTTLEAAALSDAKLAAILTALEGVTVEPWFKSHHGDGRWIDIDNKASSTIAEARSEEEAAYIAQCDPVTVLALVTELATLRAAVRKLVDLVNVYLPEDTEMTKDEFISEVIGAVDNPDVFRALKTASRPSQDTPSTPPRAHDTSPLE